jgi:hypothetical protein
MFHLRYVYDIRIPAGIDPEPFRPKPLDDEVESFEVSGVSYVAHLYK